MKSFFSLLLILFAISAVAQQMQTARGPETVFHSVNVIPMDRQVVLPNQDVVVSEGKIIAMGKTGTVKYARSAMIIDGKGKYLMPGLAEMHAHVPPVDDLEPMKNVAALFVLNGITTIRGMLGHPRHLELRKMLQQGEVFGPRLITSGPSFNGQSVKTPEAAAAMVRQQKEAGYDFLKLHPGLTKENFSALAQTAKEVGIPFAGHVSFDVGVWRAIDAGYATIDHLDGFVEALVPAEGQTEPSNGLFGMYIAGKADTAKVPALMAALQKNNIWVVPTQALAERWFAPGRSAEAFRAEPEMKYMAANTLNNWVAAKNNLLKNPAYNAGDVAKLVQLRRQLIKACQKAGVGLLLGSDAPQVFNVPGFSTHQELQYMVDAGLSPFEALQSGTVNVGRFLNKPDLGVIKQGAVADLLLLSANPLTNISNTKKIEGVMAGTAWFSKADIKRELKNLEKN
jgi:imidazolonepropionase-like amidohydrolase